LGKRETLQNCAYAKLGAMSNMKTTNDGAAATLIHTVENLNVIDIKFNAGEACSRQYAFWNNHPCYNIIHDPILASAGA
jgi:hypothetical protein